MNDHLSYEIAIFDNIFHIHYDLVIFGHWVSQNCLPKITKRKLRGYCYLEIRQNVCKKKLLKRGTPKIMKTKTGKSKDTLKIYNKSDVEFLAIAAAV